MIPYQDLNRTHRFPVITLSLILGNLFAFLLEFSLSQGETAWIYRYSLIPLEFQLGKNLPISPGLPPILTLFTSMFLHGDLLHLGGNMLYLWIFGDNIEDRMGAFRFLLFYLICGALAALTQVYTHYDSRIPTLGASGAVAGVLASYLIQFPRARVKVLVPLFYFLRVVILPAWIVLGGWLLLQVASLGLQHREAGGIAFEAHLGGFIAGLILTPAFRRRGR